MTFGLIGPLESQGYALPERMLPDISMGKMFCKWLRDAKGMDTKALPTYDHRYADGRVVQAKLYPNSVLADFRRHFNEEWLPKHALDRLRGAGLHCGDPLEEASAAHRVQAPGRIVNRTETLNFASI